MGEKTHKHANNLQKNNPRFLSSEAHDFPPQTGLRLRRRIPHDEKLKSVISKQKDP